MNIGRSAKDTTLDSCYTKSCSSIRLPSAKLKPATMQLSGAAFSNTKMFLYGGYFYLLTNLLQQVCCEETEVDEQWSFVGNKRNQRWLWHAVDHKTNAVLLMFLASVRVLFSQN